MPEMLLRDKHAHIDSLKESLDVVPATYKMECDFCGEIEENEADGSEEAARMFFNEGWRVASSNSGE